MLTFKNVSLALSGTEVLRGINFEVLPGEMVALLGASGAGKSSLFKLLIREKKPTLGTIKLDNISLGDLSFDGIQQYRRQIGIVFQDFRLLPNKTVFENICFALEICGESDFSSVKDLLRLTGLWEKRDSFPQMLSGGEKQRVAIARALVHNPKILIADEATGNLDPKNSREIADLFLKLNTEKKLTILFASHDPVLIEKLTPRVLRLEKGSILFDKNNCSVAEAFKDIL